MSYRIQKRTTTIAGKAWDVPITTVKAWMEGLPELKKGYLPEDILNLNKSGLFLKTPPQKGFVEKEKQRSRWKTK